MGLNLPFHLWNSLPNSYKKCESLHVFLNRKSDNRLDQTESVSYADNYQGCLHERPDLRRTSAASTAGFSLVSSFTVLFLRLF